MTAPPLFEEAAAILEGQAAPLSDAAKGRGMQLLADLGYLEDKRHEKVPDDTGLVANRAALLRAAGRMRRMFRLEASTAPGLVFLGGEVDPAVLGNRFAETGIGSVAGSGLTLREAFEGCVGEAVEYLSQFGSCGDEVEEADPELPRIAPFDGPDVPLFAGRSDQSWVRGSRLGDDAAVALPVERCFRFATKAAAERQPFALSTGCGAGPTLAAATLHGLLELIERDAAALWWRGGRRGRPLAPEDGAGRSAVALLAILRGGRSGRRSWLLDITTDVQVPCVAAISCDPDGLSFACGTAARLNLRDAIHAAVKEMCHIELAYEIIDEKIRVRGEAGLNAADRRHLTRARRINAADCPLLQPTGAPYEHRGAHSGTADIELAGLVSRLESMNIQFYSVNLTRKLFGIPVVRVISPELQLEPCPYISHRLSSVIEEANGGELYAAGIQLM